MALLQAIRGFNDILPQEANHWAYVEAKIQQMAQLYDYQEIRCPVLEKTEVFVRAVGEVTDIVEKEMYTFNDRNNDSLSLRPEGTAGTVRAAIEHGLLHNQIQRLWYRGPMFRHERPQAGRYRQFYQAGFEYFGVPDPYVDAELILLSARLWRELKLDSHVQLEMNTIGILAERQAYRQVLIDFFSKHQDVLDEDSQKRLHRNPLRILDSKNPAMQALIEQAPRLMDYLAPATIQHFEKVCEILKQNGVAFVFNPRLVRGLDYYTHTVFEWTTTQLGAQGTICAGGRYDGLVEKLGGKSTPAFGFALGMERILLLLAAHQLFPAPASPLAYVISVDDAAKTRAIQIAEELRSHFSETVIYDGSLASFKSQMKRADKSGAQFALIIGEEELKADTISVKFLREERIQETVPLKALAKFLQR